VQKTLKSRTVFEGVGLHTGAPVRLVVYPASADYGVWFKRTDVPQRDAFIAARWDQAERSPLCTKLRNSAGVTVSTVEHLMAALAGCGIYNALIELDGPEVPILDGSAADFVSGFLATGIRELAVPSRLLRIVKPIEVSAGAATARLDPAPGFELRFHIDFEDSAIGDQSKRLSMANGAFVRELCDSRTFCRQSDVDAMHAQGLALGGTLSNAVVVDGAQVLSPGGFRHKDEAVRHKMLDAVGDLALAGAPIFGRYTGERAGHSLTNTLLRALFADPEAYVVETCSRAMAARLPGSGLHRTDLQLVA